MQPASDSVPRMTSDGLMLVLGGRAYGEEVKTDYFGHLMQMAVPRELDALAQTLTGQSRLLALPAGAERSAIYEAYGHDLGLMERYRGAFKTCIDAAVRARAHPDHKTAQAFLDRMIAEIAPVLHEPTLDLGAEALKLEPAVLLERLQGELRADVESLARNVAFWLHLLAESEYVSLVEWMGDGTALQYHFFRMDEVSEETGRKVERTGNLFEGVTTTTTIRKFVRVLNERRDHTVVNARSWVPDQYPEMVPARIARLLDDIPAEVRPFVTIADGHVTREEVRRRLATSKIEVETHSVYRPDPAVVLFNTWAVNGWGGSAEEAAISTYQGHPRRRTNGILAFSALATLAVAAAAVPFAGPRGALLVAVIGLVLTALSQLGMRIDQRKR